MVTGDLFDAFELEGNKTKKKEPVKSKKTKKKISLRKIEGAKQKFRKYIGPPGTGKTTRILKDLEEVIATGQYTLENTIFCSFTNAAVSEARDRLLNQLTKSVNLTTQHSIRFKTIHSLCGNLIGFKADRLIKDDASKDKKQFLLEDYDNKIIYYHDEEEITKRIDERYYIDTLTEQEKNSYVSRVSNINSSDVSGEQLFALYYFVINNYPEKFDRITELSKSISEMIRRYNSKVEEIIKLSEIEPMNSFADIAEFLHNWHKYKKTINKYEFVDLLYQVWRKKLAVPHKLLIVDEFQDLTRLQFLIFEHWRLYSREVWVAGDPDQSIYGFSGGSPQYLVSVFEQEQQYTKQDEVFLHKSYRLPQTTLEYAKSILPDGYVNQVREDPLISYSQQAGIVMSITLKQFLLALQGMYQQNKQEQIKKEIYILCRTNKQIEEMKQEIFRIGTQSNYEQILDQVYPLTDGNPLQSDFDREINQLRRDQLDEKASLIIVDSLGLEENKPLSNKFKEIVKAYTIIQKYIQSTDRSNQTDLKLTLKQLIYLLPLLSGIKENKRKEVGNLEFENDSLLKKGLKTLLKDLTKLLNSSSQQYISSVSNPNTPDKKKIRDFVKNLSRTKLQYKWLLDSTTLKKGVAVGQIIAYLLDAHCWENMLMNRDYSLEDRIGNNLISNTQKLYFEKYVSRELTMDEILEPTVFLDTIHKSKGKEADTVFILNKATKYENSEIIDLDEEARVWYVATTRSKGDVYLIESDNPTMFLH